MKLNQLLKLLLKIFIVLLLINFIHCKKKKNKDYEYDSESGASSGSTRTRVGSSQDYEADTERSTNPTRRSQGNKKKIPPGHQRRSGGLPPGLAKKQNYREESPYYDEPEETIVNPPRNVNKPNRGTSSPNRGTSISTSISSSNNNQNNFQNDYPNNQNNQNDYSEYGITNSNSNSRPQNQNQRPPPQSKPQPFPSSTEDSVSSIQDIPQSEWRQLDRLKHHWENTAHTRSELSKKFIFWLERDTDYQKYDACLTPDTKKLGHCHFVQHCPIPDVIRSFDKFLTYACFIRNRYVGICCPNDYLDPEETQPQQSVPQPMRQTLATTRRPQSRPPNRPPSGFTNDGSDYNNGSNKSDVTLLVIQSAECPKTPESLAERWPTQRTGCGWYDTSSERMIIVFTCDPNPTKAALILRSQSKPYCGGVLITNQHILTAAHCLVELTPDDVTVRLGAYDFSASADPEAQDFAIEYFKIHSRYNRVTNENDVALIKLRSKTRLSEAIKPICLPQRNRDYAGQLAIVTGWGKTSFGGRGSPQLRQVSLPVWNNTQCDASYSLAIQDIMLCAGNRQGGKDSCQGDSGGPLMLQGPNKRWMVIGVVSFGIKCGQPEYPGVYTRVSKYIDWIQQNTKDDI